MPASPPTMRSSRAATRRRWTITQGELFGHCLPALRADAPAGDAEGEYPVLSYGADAPGQPLQPGEDEEGACGGYAGASGEEAGGASSGGREGAERAAGHEGAGSGRRELEGGDAQAGRGEDFRV